MNAGLGLANKLCYIYICMYGSGHAFQSKIGLCQVLALQISVFKRESSASGSKMAKITLSHRRSIVQSNNSPEEGRIKMTGIIAGLWQI